MPFDPYSPCPGGTGKKIKFCCPDLAAQLEKVVRTLEGEQHQACLTYIDRLLKSHPDRACLFATRTLLLRRLDRIDEAETAARDFLEKHPRNPLALAETAMLAALTGRGPEAMEPMLRAIEVSGSAMYGRVYDAMSVVSHVLAAEGEFVAARALASLQTAIRREDRQPAELFLQLIGDPGVPLVLKGERRLGDCPGDAPWKARFDEAISLAHQAQWLKATELLADLSGQVDDAPAIWRNLAALRGWTADTPGCVRALQKFATLDVPLEDAVEAEATCRFLSDDPLGDAVDVLDLSYSVGDADQLAAALCSAPQAFQVRQHRMPSDADEGPPPMAVFLLFDRPSPEPGTEITVDGLPRLLCDLLLYGKETDREARLEVVDLLAGDLDRLEALLTELAGQPLGSPGEREVGQQISASRELLTRRWRVPKGWSRDQYRGLVGQRVEEAMLETWPQCRLGLLDGKSPLEVADQPPYRIRLLAAILVLECWLEQSDSRFDLNRLRSRLGLPTLEPIDPDETPIEDLPPIRWSRVMVDKLSDGALLDAYRRAAAYGARTALRSFARAVTERASLSDRSEQLLAFRTLARLADNSDEALQYIEQGRHAAEQIGQSTAPWDLIELSFRMDRLESEEVGRLIDHLRAKHLHEPGVVEALADFLVRAGLLRPDGTPAVPPDESAEEEPSLVVPGQPGAEPGKLWTPGSQQPADKKPKIWTPGMD